MPKDDDVAKELATSILNDKVVLLQERASFLMEPRNECLLEGVLQLVKELSQVLNKVHQQGLVELLIKR